MNETKEFRVSEVPLPCRLGYTEYDGARYCFEHGGFLEAGVQSMQCARALACPLCGFDARTFEPRREKQWGAFRYHMALHESGRVIPVPGEGQNEPH